MKHRPSSEHLTHLYPMWQGCTLGEIVVAAGSTLLGMLLVLLLLGAILGHESWVLWVMIPWVLIGPKLAMKRLARFKETKPPGFVMIKGRMALGRYFPVLFKAPYVHRAGLWSTGRRMTHV